MKKIDNELIDKLITASILIAVLLILSIGSLKAQYGFNATNTPALLDAETRGYIVDMSGNDFWLVFRNDKYTGNAPQLDIDNTLALGNDLKLQGKELKIIYTVNARGLVTLSQNFYAFDQLQSYVKAIRIGNEEFFKEAGHNKLWDNYLNTNTALIDFAKTKNLPILFSWADPSWVDWNAKAANYINSNPLFYPDLHLYWSGQECPILNTLVDKKLPSEKLISYSVAKDTFYRDLYTQITSSSFLEEIISNMRLLMPNKDIYVTEFGAAIGVGEIGNTFATEATNDWLINEAKKYPEIKVLCKFNLGSVTGVITDASSKDLVTGKVKRTGYYSMQMSIKYKDAIPYQFLGEGSFVFTLQNLTRAQAALQLPEGYYFETLSYECIKAENYYSSSGTTAWQSVGSVKSYEISGTQILDYIPAMSYGYLTVTVKKLPVFGCMDRDALNYNPLATINEGCEYPKECLKKRWLFTSLPCKTSKRICDCN